MWRLVIGKKKRVVSENATAVTATEQAAMDSWDEKALKAAGELYLAVSDDQKTHLEALRPTLLLSEPNYSLFTSRSVLVLVSMPGSRSLRSRCVRMSLYPL